MFWEDLKEVLKDALLQATSVFLIVLSAALYSDQSIRVAGYSGFLAALARFAAYYSQYVEIGTLKTRKGLVANFCKVI